jgi:hypothetical protein
MSFLETSKPDVPDQTFDLGAFDGSDNTKAHPLWSETEIGYLLDLLVGDLLKFSCTSSGSTRPCRQAINDSPIHDLVGRTFKA